MVRNCYAKRRQFLNKKSTKDKHFALLPLVVLTGKPLMCIIIIVGKKPDVLVEMGINNGAEINGEEGDADFLEEFRSW